MKPFILLVTLLFGCHCASTAQASFQCAGSGNWDSPSTWTFIDGTTSTNYPVSGDTVTLAGGYTVTVDVNSQCTNLAVKGAATLLMNSTASILTVSNQMTVSGASFINLNLGVLTVTGTMSVNAGSTVTITQGALTVIGVMALTSPTSPAGTTLLDVEGGVFSCAGGMTITATTVPSGRYAELQIGNSAVNLVGGLVTVSANAKIDFTGPGALSLAGVINIANTSSFIAGNGKTIYLNLPGTDQTVAPLNYYNLVITGLGASAGIKNINGAVTVADSLTLLTDTLTVNSGGSLTLASEATIVRTGGIITYAPTFTGTVNLVYNDIQQDTTGPEMPVSTTILQNLTIDDIAGIQLGSATTVNDTLNLQQGPLITGNYALTITNPAGGDSTDPAITRNNGYVVGAINRDIGTSAGLRIFPFGTSGFPSDYREFDLDYTSAPTSAGLLSVQHVDTAAPAQSGLPLNDAGEIIVNVAPMYWQADASGGLSGGSYTVTLIAQGAPGVSDISTLRIIKRPSSGGPWAVYGAEGTNSGTTSEPVMVRNNVSGFSQFTFGSDYTNVLPLSLLSFSGNSAGSNVVLNWSTPVESDTEHFTIQHSTDGITFTTLGTVTNAYTFTEWNAPAGPNYYCLAQLSSVIEVVVPNANILKAYPNPAPQSVTIEADRQFPILLFDISGRFVQSMTPGINDISRLPAGVYFIKNEGGVVKLVHQ